MLESHITIRMGMGKPSRAGMDDRAGCRYRQSGVIPLRHRRGRVEILLITSRDGRRWSIPKGTIEPYLSPADSAAKEAWEEAGIRGCLDPTPVGDYCYDKAGRVHRVLVFRLDVDEILEDWPEQHFRRRQWLSPADAVARASSSSLKTLLQSVVPPSGNHAEAPGDSDVS